MTHSERLKSLREEKGLSQYRLAKLSGVSQTYISKYELGIRNVGLPTIEKLCPALGITVAEFLSPPHEMREDGTVVPIAPLTPDEWKKEALLDTVLSNVQDLDYEALAALDKYVQFLKGKG